MYGKNEKEKGKLRAPQELIVGREVKEIAQILHVTEATAQVYGIDAFFVGAPIDHVVLATILEVTEANLRIFSTVSRKTRTVRSGL